MEPITIITILIAAVYLISGLAAWGVYLRSEWELAPFIEKIFFAACGPLLWLNFLVVWKSRQRRD